MPSLPGGQGAPEPRPEPAEAGPGGPGGPGGPDRPGRPGGPFNNKRKYLA